MPKQAIIERLERARSEKVPFGLPIPETSEAQKAQEILDAATQEQCREILKTKVPKALIRWATEKMGEDIGKFLDEGLRFYFFSVLLYSAITNKKTDPLADLKEIPFVIPMKLKRSPLFPVDPHKLLQEYEKILPKVKVVLIKTRRHRLSRKMKLITELGISEKDADKFVEANTKASLIAYYCVSRNSALSSVHAEAVKKYARYAKDPELLLKRIARDFEKRSGYHFDLASQNRVPLG